LVYVILTILSGTRAIPTINEEGIDMSYSSGFNLSQCYAATYRITPQESIVLCVFLIGNPNQHCPLLQILKQNLIQKEHGYNDF